MEEWQPSTPSPAISDRPRGRRAGRHSGRGCKTFPHAGSSKLGWVIKGLRQSPGKTMGLVDP
eukprot:11175947-Lingulodinium_polyedra.AAC.1